MCCVRNVFIAAAVFALVHAIVAVVAAYVTITADTFMVVFVVVVLSCRCVSFHTNFFVG